MDRVQLFAFDLDGTLTDGTTFYASDSAGWVQRYHVRDGEAILRMVKIGVVCLPLSRNKTDHARRRIRHLGLSNQWLGVNDKLRALDEICVKYDISPSRIAFVGDGADDAPVLRTVGLGFAVADAHPAAKKAAKIVLQSRGGDAAVEEIEQHLVALEAI